MNDPICSLVAPLSPERLKAMPEWLGSELCMALSNPGALPTTALLAVGRALRAAAGPREDRAVLERWAPEALKSEALGALLDRGLDAATIATEGLRAYCASSPDAQGTLVAELEQGTAEWQPGAEVDEQVALEAIQARDELESAAWVFGLVRRQAPDSELAAVGEARLLEAAEGIDAVGKALRVELRRSLAGRPDPWLQAVAGLYQVWWLDAWSPYFPSASVLDGLFDEAPSGQLLRIFPSRVRLEQPMAAASGSHAAEEALLVDPGPVLAQLHDGKVEVYGVGLDADDGVTPGLVVRAGPGLEFGAIEKVMVLPPAPASPEKDEVVEAWWVSLAGCGPEQRELCIVLRGGAQLQLELKPE